MCSPSERMSPAEKSVYEYLNSRKVKCFYEFPVALFDEQKHIRLWYPDFYLPSLGVYLEVCGTEKDKKEKYRRQQLFKENDIPILFLHCYKEDTKWTVFLDNLIHELEKDRQLEAQKLMVDF